jgi:hypothetical protein
MVGLTLWSSASGIYQSQGKFENAVLSALLSPTIAWLLLPVVVGLIALQLRSIDQRLGELVATRRAGRVTQDDLARLSIEGVKFDLSHVRRDQRSYIRVRVVVVNGSQWPVCVQHVGGALICGRQWLYPPALTLATPPRERIAPASRGGSSRSPVSAARGRARPAGGGLGTERTPGERHESGLLAARGPRPVGSSARDQAAVLGGTHPGRRTASEGRLAARTAEPRRRAAERRVAEPVGAPCGCGLLHSAPQWPRAPEDVGRARGRARASGSGGRRADAAS